MLFKLKTWFFICRPWSVTATLAPCLVAGALCRGADGFVLWRWLLALAAALPLQIACNLLNTWGDDRSGVDAVEGAVLTTPQLQSGLVSPRAVLAGAAACLALAGLLGAPLFFFADAAGGWRVNWAVAAAAAAGLLGTLNYSTGITFKYRGLGVPFVFLLMGPIETVGFAAAAAPLRFAALPAREALEVCAVSLPVAALVAAIMHGNDMRDIPTDRRAGICTPSTALGPRGALALYFALHLLPFFFCAVRAARVCAWPAFLPLLALPLAAATLRNALTTYRNCPENPPWRGLERASGGVHLVFSLLYTLALAL